MNLEDENIIEPEVERLLDRMSSYFNRERERIIIQDIVSKKIAATDFNLMTIKKNGTAKYGTIGLSFLALLILSTSLYFVFRNDSQVSNAVKAHNEINKSEPFDNEKTNIDRNELKVSGEDISGNELNRQSEPNEQVSKITRTVEKPLGNKNLGNGAISSDVTVEQTKVFKGQQIRTLINIGHDISIEDVRKEISNMLLNFGFTLEKNKGSEYDMLIKTKSITALSESGSPVEYIINFKVDKKNPSLLRIYLEYYVQDKNIYLNDNENTVEDMFYKKIADHLKHFFAYN